MNAATEAEGFAKFVGIIKDFKELILVVVLLGSGIAWTINYFATRQELENYKCINNLTVAMIVNTQSEEYFEQAIRVARREVRSAQNALRGTRKDSPAFASMEQQIEDLEANLKKVVNTKADAEKKRQAAFDKLQAIQLGTSKPCS